MFEMTKIRKLPIPVNFQRMTGDFSFQSKRILSNKANNAFDDHGSPETF